MTNPQWTISVNGKVGDHNSSVPALDRGLLFGDSVYEVTVYRDNTLIFWEEHFERMTRSAEGIGLDLGFTQDELFALTAPTVKAANLEGRGYVRMVITKGFHTNIGLVPEELNESNKIIYVQPMPELPREIKENGLRLWINEKIIRNPRQSTDPNLKTGNYLNSILALQEAKRKGYDDAIMRNVEDKITEGTTFNIWGVKENTVYTPPLQAGILLGITRKTLLRLAEKEGIKVEEKLLSPEELLDMDEIFTSSAVKNVMSVGQVNEKKFNINDYKLAPRLRDLLEQETKEYIQTHPQWRVT